MDKQYECQCLAAQLLLLLLLVHGNNSAASLSQGINNSTNAQQPSNRNNHPLTSHHQHKELALPSVQQPAETTHTTRLYAHVASSCLGTLAALHHTALLVLWGSLGHSLKHHTELLLDWCFSRARWNHRSPTVLVRCTGNFNFMIELHS